MCQRLLIALIAVMISGLSFSANADVSSTFDTDMDGWTATGPALTWGSTGGNPGGYLAYADSSWGYLTDAIAPAKFLGDWGTYDGGSIRFDHRVISGTIVDYNHYRVFLAGPADSAEWLGPMSTGLTPWLSFGVPLEEEVWSLFDGSSWSDLLANVTVFRIRIEVIDGYEHAGMDNVILTEEPSCITHADCDDGDWCTIDECVRGLCQHTMRICDDGIDCTSDMCDSFLEACLFTPNDWLCDDGDTCTFDTCDPFEGCIYTPNPNCASVGSLDGIPTAFHLSQNEPNPFNPVTEIRYALPVAGEVRLTVYDVSGRALVTLLQGRQSPGCKQVTWYAGNLPGGIYFYRLEAAGYVETRKMILVK